MASLTNTEKRRFERLLQMGGGYLLNFSNRTFEEFVSDSVARNIYDAQYESGSGSKASRLRAFWSAEGNRLVGKLMADMLDYAVETASVQKDDPALEECRRTVSRLMQDSPVSELDALTAISNEKDFEAVAKAVKEAIERNELRMAWIGCTPSFSSMSVPSAFNVASTLCAIHLFTACLVRM